MHMHMPVCLYSSRTETITMINFSTVCANDSRIKWFDLTGSNFLDESNTAKKAHLRKYPLPRGYAHNTSNK